MRILIFPSWYPTAAKPISGVFVREQADALYQAHTVRVLYLDVLPRGARRHRRQYVSQERGYIEEVIEIPNYPLVWQFIYLWYMVRAFRRLRQEFAPDLIHCHVAVPAGWGAAVLHRLFGVPVVLTEHSSEFASWQRRPGLDWMARHAFAGADMVIAVSKGQRESLQKAYPHNKRLVIIPNVVNIQRFTPSPLPPTAPAYRLLFVGLLDTDQKGVPILLEALVLLQKKGLLIHLDLIGDGTLRIDYQEQAQRLDLGAMVTFHGLQPPAVVAQMLQQAHVLVQPSLHESQGLTIIEALVSGRPAISTRCGGPEFMINESNGRIVEPGQAAPLAEAIAEVLTHLDRYDPPSIAIAAADRYSYTAVTAALTDVFRLLVHK